MGKLNFYIVDKKYLEFLKRYGDSKVPNYEYKHTKFYIGIILNINGYKYFAPVSSFNIQQKTNYLIKVYDKYYNKMRVSSSVRLCFMIPVNEDLVHKFCINNYYRIQDRGLIRKELKWCRQHTDEIRKLAQKVYNWGCNIHCFQHKNCCDFKKLELAYNIYINQSQQEVAATRIE